jgi:hypothetical protein
MIAEKFNLSLLTDGSSLHLLTDKKASQRLFNLMLNTKIQRILSPVVTRRKSLLADDYYHISGEKIQN